MPTYVRTALIASALYLTACASTPEKLQGADYYYAEGQKAYEKKRCVEASEHFQRLVSNFPGSQRVTESQYMLAESYFCSEDYVNAAFEYQRLIDIYPASNWASEAQFKIGESFFEQMRRPELDQKETYEALTAFRNFIEDNPGLLWSRLRANAFVPAARTWQKRFTWVHICIRNRATPRRRVCRFKTCCETIRIPRGITTRCFA